MSAGIKSVSSRTKGKSLLTVFLVSAILFACFTAGVSQTSLRYSTALSSSRGSMGEVASDPSAYMYGYHLYDKMNCSIPVTGKSFTLTYPSNWNVTGLGLNFFNGTLQKNTYVNSTPVETSVTTAMTNGYYDPITNLNIPPNSTVYQVQFNITALQVGNTTLSTTPDTFANSTYPSIDGNVGIAEKFNITGQAQNLTIGLDMFRLPGTQDNLTIDVRSLTDANTVGGLIKSISVTPTTIPLAKNVIVISIPYVNLTAGNYLITLHTQDWLSSGGGYVVDTLISKQTSNPASAWVTSNRGVDWQNQVNIGGSTYYFTGFRLSVQTAPPAIPSEVNLRINGVPVADNFIWNQTVWNSASPYVFLVTSNYEIPLLNFTYKAWYYNYTTTPNRLIPQGYYIMLNNNINTNTTALNTGHGFTMMYVTLNSTDLQQAGAINSTASTITLNLKLFNSTQQEIAGFFNVTAVVQLQMKPVSQAYTGPYSLTLQYEIKNTNSQWGQDNVTLSQSALSISPISGQIDNIFINGTTYTPRNVWTYSPTTESLNVSREAFTSVPQFTLENDTLLNCTVTVFNNCTATAQTIINGIQTYPSPDANLIVQNITPIIDLDGPPSVYITVTNPSGVVIDETLLNLVGGQYTFSTTVVGEGIYGIKITSVDFTGYNATRWIGAAVVEDYQLSPPVLTLTPSGNLTSGESVKISAGLTYLNHSDFTFNGTVVFSVSLLGGPTVNLVASRNSTTGLYEAIYNVPTVSSVTLMMVQAVATDIRDRISTNSTSTYVVPTASTTIPTLPPSSLAIIELGIIAVILLVPIVAYLIAKFRRK